MAGRNFTQQAFKLSRDLCGAVEKYEMQPLLALDVHADPFVWALLCEINHQTRAVSTLFFMLCNTGQRGQSRGKHHLSSCYNVPGMLKYRI